MGLGNLLANFNNLFSLACSNFISKAMNMFSVCAMPYLVRIISQWIQNSGLILTISRVSSILIIFRS